MTDQEIAELVSAGQKRLADNAAMTCARPVLRGTPRGGVDRGATVEQMQRSGSRATRCRDVLGQVRKVVSATLFQCAPPDADPGDPDPVACRARPPTDPAWMSDPIVAITSACGPLIEQMRVAVGFEDACAPSIPGRPHRDVASEVDIGVAAIAIAGHRARAGRWVEAFELVLDAVRWQQDVGRGGGPVKKVHTTSAMIADLVGYGHDLLAQGPYTAEQLGRLDRELARLAAGDIEPGPLFGNIDLAAATRNGWLDLLAGTGPAASDPDPDSTRAFASRADAVAVRWLASKRIASDLAAACPSGRSLAQCLEALSRLDTRWRAERDALASALGGELAVRDILGRDHPVATLRRDVVTAWSAGDTEPYQGVVRRLATRLGDVVGLRLHVALRRQALSSRSCPDLEALSAATASMRSPDRLGGSITIEPAASGAFWVRAPGWLARRAGASTSRPARKLARITCPGVKS